MEIVRYWRSGVVVLLVCLGLAAYTSIAIEPALKEGQKECCSKENVCPLQKHPPAVQSGSSIIWDSMTDNLLSAHI